MKMYKVKISIDGVLKEIEVNAKDSLMAMNVITNMYGNEKSQILDIRRI